MKTFLYGFLIFGFIIFGTIEMGLISADEGKFANLEGKVAFGTIRSRTGDVVLLQDGDIQLVDKIADSPRFSPDGTKLLYVAMKYRPGKIAVLNLHNKEQKFYEVKPEPGAMAWLVSDNKILYEGIVDFKREINGLFIFDPVSGNVIKIHEFDPGFDVSAFDVTKEGNKIAIELGAPKGSDRSGIYLGTLSGDKIKDLQYFISKGEKPRFSPEGRMLAFVKIPDPKVHPSTHLREIFVLDLETKEESRLTNNEWEDREPCWSPDGKKILFVSNRRKGYPWGGELFLLNLDDRSETQVSFGKPIGEVIGSGGIWTTDDQPDWAP